jgi:opacity protein-like surface antigen
MIGKFASASVLLFTILLGAQAFAQTTPPEQPPAAPPATTQAPATQQAPGTPTAADQEPAEETTSSSRHKKIHDYKNWSYNVGAGANLDSGTTKTYVRGGGFVATAGVARNANKYFGLRGDFIFADLPLRDSSLRLAQATGASSYFFGVTVDPVINIPVTKLWGGYVLFGPGFYHRSGSLDSSAAVPGSSCNGFFTWWGACPNVSIPLSGSFVNSSQNDFGYNFGGGITRKVPSGVEIYAEYRFTHGTNSGITTDVRPITVGFRW